MYDFPGSESDSAGTHPSAGVIRDKAGNLYGTTATGGGTGCTGVGCGTVYKLDTTGKETVLLTALPDLRGTGLTLMQA